jgi:hypothetical protein
MAQRRFSTVSTSPARRSRTRPSPMKTRSFGIVIALTLASCGDQTTGPSGQSPVDSGRDVPGGSGGALATGGTAGGAGGATGGAGGGTGGAGTGGPGTGGAGGGAGSDAGRDADASPMTDTKDVAGPVSDGGGLADGPPAAGLDECFRSIPAPSGYQELQTKISVDGQVRVRILLDTFDYFGTSGTKGFQLVRFGVQRAGEAGVCITDRSALTYKITHHNYEDVATATAGGVTYLTNLKLTYGPPIARTEDISGTGGPKPFGPVKLRDVACHGASAMKPDQGCVFRDGVPLTAP